MGRLLFQIYQKQLHAGSISQLPYFHSLLPSEFKECSPSPGFTVLSAYRAVCSPLVVTAGVRLLARSHLWLGPCQRFSTNNFPPLRRIPPMAIECYKDNIKPAVKTML